MVVNKLASQVATERKLLPSNELGEILPILLQWPDPPSDVSVAAPVDLVHAEAHLDLDLEHSFACTCTLYFITFLLFLFYLFSLRQ